MIFPDTQPAIIDREMFDAAEQERRRRSTRLGRDHKKKTFSDKIIIPKEFTMGKAKKRIAEPFAQAEYLYSPNSHFFLLAQAPTTQTG